MAVSFLSVPIMARYLSPERYGFFLTVTALAMWIGLADLGLGNGLTNRLAQANAREDQDLQAQLVGTALLSVGSVCALLTLGLVVGFGIVPWRAVFAVGPELADSEIHTTVVVVLGLWLLNIPLGLVDKVYAGYQMIHVNNAWSVVAGCLSLAGLAFAVSQRATLPWVVLSVHGALPLVRLASWLRLCVQKPHLRPRFRNFRLDVAGGLFKLGGGFLIAQLAAIGVWQSDQIILSHVVGPSSVGPYVVTLRLATLYLAMLMTWLAPFWPACADAAARNEWSWVSTVYLRALKRSMLTTLFAAAGLAALGGWAIAIWAGARVTPSQGLLSAMAVYLLALVWCQVHAVLLNALGKVSGQASYGVLAAILNVGLSIWLGQHFGATGVCVATILAVLPACVLSNIELRWVLRTEQAQRL